MAVCSPPNPLTDNPSGLQMALAFASVPSLVRFGTLMCIQAFNAFNSIQSGFQSIKYFIQDCTLLHAHDTQMIFFTNPDDKLLIRGDVTTSSGRPVRGNSCRSEITIIGHVFEHEVSLHQLIVCCGINEVRVSLGQGIISTSECVLQYSECTAHFVLHIDSIFFGHGTRQWEICQVTTNSNTHRQFTDSQIIQVQLSTLW